MSQKVYTSFEDFYPFYLNEHLNPINRKLHFVGTSIVFIIFVIALAIQKYTLIFACPLAGYGFAWIGHFVFEKNKPATFKYPRWSLMGDFKMWFELATLQRGFDERKSK